MYLKAEDITKSYDNEVIIEKINISVDYGERVTLLGASGIGKTTLFNVLSGLENPDSGRVLLKDNDITGKPGMIGYMQQEDLLLPFKTVLDNVSIPFVLGGLSKKEAALKALPMFEVFGLSGTERKYPSQLSGGMRQRAALLRAHLFKSDLMLLDEPFSALDAMTKSAMHNWFINITKHQKISALIITHDIDEAIMLSDRIYIMSSRPGRITSEIKINYKGIRDKDFAVSEDFISYKKDILQLL